MVEDLEAGMLVAKTVIPPTGAIATPQTWLSGPNARGLVVSVHFVPYYLLQQANSVGLRRTRGLGAQHAPTANRLSGERVNPSFAQYADA